METRCPRCRATNPQATWCNQCGATFVPAAVGQPAQQQAAWGPPGSPIPSLPTPTAPSWGLLATRRWSPRTGLTLRSGLEPETRRVARRRPQRRATSVPFTEVLNGLQRTTTDNATARSTSAGPHPRRWQQRPNWLCKQVVSEDRLIPEPDSAQSVSRLLRVVCWQSAGNWALGGD
jgi:hypothetical protein